MPQGLQVFNASGNVILDTNVRTVRILGQFTTTPGAPGSVNIDTSQGTPWYQVYTNVLKNYDRPAFTLSGSTLSWTAAPFTANVKYGTF